MIDAHHHLWRLSRGDYDWPTPGMAIHRDYGLDDLHEVCGDVTRTILVQTTPTEAETADMFELAASSDGLIAGVVGWTDLSAPDVLGKIDALRGRLVGLRPMLQNLSERRWILRPDVQPALRALPGAGLALDLLILSDQLEQVPVLARAHPDLRMVIDHAAKPQIKHRRFQPWADDIARAAEASNVFCKLSGLVTEAGETWTVDDLRPYVDQLLKVFGAERLMWGSDWPVVDLAGGYRVWSDAADALIGSHRRQIRASTAEAFYRPGAPTLHTARPEARSP